MPIASAGTFKPFERVMVFIDGGYMWDLCKEHCGHESWVINFDEWVKQFIHVFNNLEGNPFQANLIRIYYYDAIVKEGHPDYKAQREYFDHIEGRRYYTVRLGKLVESSKRKKRKQKGVDVLMAIDALTKAYQDQYDIGVFMMGDGDFLPLIEAVKDAGKKTLLVYHEKNTSIDLKRCFDWRIGFDKENIESWVKEG